MAQPYNTRTQEDVICPYSRCLGRSTIGCSGYLEGATLTMVTFSTPTDCTRHMRAYCDTYRWPECPTAALIDAMLEAHEEAPPDGEA